MLGALLAAAVWERNQPAEATALLANRLDVLERSGLPEAVLLGYRTVARVGGGRAPRTARSNCSARCMRWAGAPPATVVHRQPGRPGAAACAPLPPRNLPWAVRSDRTLLADTGSPKGRLWRRSVELLREVAPATRPSPRRNGAER